MTSLCRGLHGGSSLAFSVVSFASFTFSLGLSFSLLFSDLSFVFSLGLLFSFPSLAFLSFLPSDFLAFGSFELLLFLSAFGCQSSSSSSQPSSSAACPTGITWEKFGKTQTPSVPHGKTIHIARNRTTYQDYSTEDSTYRSLQPLFCVAIWPLALAITHSYVLRFGHCKLCHRTKQHKVTVRKLSQTSVVSDIAQCF